MRRLLKLAWRDIWRNRRRTLITMSAIVFGVLLITLSRSSEDGTYDIMEERLVQLFLGDIQIHSLGYDEERTLEHSMAEDELDAEDLAAAYPWVTGWARRLSGFGLASSDSSSAGAMIVGIEPERENALSRIVQNVRSGNALNKEDNVSVLLGESLARNLSVAPRDTIVVITQGYRNVMGAELYVVAGLIRTGNPDLDRSIMIMTLQAAQELLTMPGRFTELILRTDEFQRAEGRAQLVELDRAEFEVLSWRELMPELAQMRQLDKAGNFVFYLFLLLLVGFEIFNTTTMSMMERVREFGVMMAMGLKPLQISLLVAMELLMKVVLAVGIGALLGFVLATLLAENPIPLSAEMQSMYEDFGFAIDGIYFSSRIDILVFPVVSVLVITVISMVYPVVKMQRFSPVAALRNL